MNKKPGMKTLSITISEELLSEIANAISVNEMNDFIAEAVRLYLLRLKQLQTAEKAFGAWQIENHPELVSPQDTSDYVRSIRDADEYGLSQPRRIDDQ